MVQVYLLMSIGGTAIPKHRSDTFAYLGMKSFKTKLVILICLFWPPPGCLPVTLFTNVILLEDLWPNLQMALYFHYSTAKYFQLCSWFLKIRRLQVQKSWKNHRKFVPHFPETFAKPLCRKFKSSTLKLLLCYSSWQSPQWGFSPFLCTTEDLRAWLCR